MPFPAREVEIDGIVYKTAEHAYQALLVVPQARFEIMKTRSPMDTWREGQGCKKEGKLLTDIDKLILMEIIFRAKLAQHDDIGKILKN